MQPGSPVWSRTLPHAECGTANRQKAENFYKRSKYWSRLFGIADTIGNRPETGEGPTIAAGPLATLLCCARSPLFLFFPPPCCETAILENEVGDPYCLLAARSAPHLLNTGDLVQRHRLAPNPRVGPVLAIRDRSRYRLRSQPIIENCQARELRARLQPQ